MRVSRFNHYSRSVPPAIKCTWYNFFASLFLLLDCANMVKRLSFLGTL